MSCHVMILGSLTVLGVILTSGGVMLTQPGPHQGEDVLDETGSGGYNPFVSRRRSDLVKV